jgi:type IV pilus assembly protein PilW
MRLRLPTRPRLQSGVTLIELMVALTLGLILTAAAIQVFVANKSTYRLTNALSQVQENGRYAMQQLAHDIRMAGYFGCGSRQQMKFNLVATGVNFIPAALPLEDRQKFIPRNALRGFDSGTGWWTAGTPPADVAGNDLALCDAATGDTTSCKVSDVVTVLRGAELGMHLTADMVTGATPPRVSADEFRAMRPAIVPADDEPGEEDLVLLTDCDTADLFRATAVTAVGSERQITPNAALTVAYLQGPAAGGVTTSATLYSLWGASYFVADPALDKDGDGVAEPVAALYRIGPTDEGTVPPAVLIAEGVERMEVSYGLDTGGADESAERYLTSAQVNAEDVAGNGWERVVSVRVALLIKSKEDFVTDEPVAVRFVDGTMVNNGPGADRRLRLIFSQTIGIRNRVQ